MATRQEKAAEAAYVFAVDAFIQGFVDLDEAPQAADFGVSDERAVEIAGWLLMTGEAGKKRVA